MPREGVTGLILAGGTSRRMGRDKAFLPWGKTTLIEHLLERLRPVTDELIVAVKDAQAFRYLQATVVEDCVPDAHALGGLYTGLRAASHERCFVCACDTPFLNPAVIRWLIRLVDGYDLVIPHTPDGLQPLYAVYRTSVLSVIEEQVRRRDWTLTGLVGRLHAKIVEADVLRCVDPQGFSFFNVNTPDEYLTARERWRAHEGLDGQRQRP